LTARTESVLGAREDCGCRRLRAPAAAVACSVLLAAGAAPAMDASPRPASHGGDVRKLDGRLQLLAGAGLGADGAEHARSAARRLGLTVSQQGAVSVDVYVTGDVTRAARGLRGLGMRVGAVSRRAPTRVVEGYLPAAALVRAAGLASTRTIVPTLTRLSSGGTLSEGDAAIRGPQARAFGATGAGVVVGVISDSIDQNPVGGLAASIASGDLPANTQVLAENPLGGGTDEGRAMAEVIYDQAPGISGILFQSGSGGPAAKASAIDNLVAHGARVIADDTSDISEPYWQDGIVAQAVDRAKAAGVAYIAAAGNDAGHAWEAYWLSRVVIGVDFPTDVNNFDSGGDDPVMTVGTVAPNRDVVVELQWAEPWGTVANDLMLHVAQFPAGMLTFDTPDSVNPVTGVPQEFAVVHGGANGGTFAISIQRNLNTSFPGVYVPFLPGPGIHVPYMRVVTYPQGGGTVNYEYTHDASAINGGAASARGALTVGASRYDAPATPEPFSSNGPVTRFFKPDGTPVPFEVRAKPELLAPDGVATNVARLSPFSGTSASAASAAGTAALIRSANPALTVDALYAIMKNPANALACTTPGAPSLQCGVGLLLADRAVAMADPTPPVVTAMVSPAKPNGAKGWYRGAVSVTWSTSDTNSPLISATGCGAVKPRQGTTTLTCNATSSAGTTSVPLTIKRDSTPPSTPVLTGIRAARYTPATLPRASAIRCHATDRTSGIARCTVKGYDSTPGRHTLTAVARNGAGRMSTFTRTYTVTRLPAISHLAIAAGGTANAIARSGVALTLTAATSRTRLTIQLRARTPSTGPTASQRIVASLSRTIPAGSVALRITLTASAKQALLTYAGGTLEVVLRGTSDRAKPATLRRSLILHGG
jgi:hypothetical protein